MASSVLIRATATIVVMKRGVRKRSTESDTHSAGNSRGGTGARTLLGAVASSTIGVAGTVFSITIAALSLAAGQMGPHLLRNFTRDRGVQITLGTFLGTFSYALMVLRSVRTQDEGVFTPHLSLSVSIVLAFVCVATLIYFVGHMASRINVDTVVELVSKDVRSAMKRLTTDERGPMSAGDGFWADAVAIADPRRGYLQELDAKRLADWAASRRVAIRLLVRPGDYTFPGAPIAIVKPPHAGAEAAIRDATALGDSRISSSDLAYPVRQLVEVAVRALSSGINDPSATKQTVMALPQFDYASDSTRRDQSVASAEQDIASGKTKVTDLEKKADTTTADAKVKFDGEITGLRVDVKSAETNWLR